MSGDGGLDPAGWTAFRALAHRALDSNLGIDVAALRAAIAADRAAGKTPFAIVATAGSASTGAFDDLNALATLAQAERLWLHVDGAFGALTQLAPPLRSRVRGIERGTAAGEPWYTDFGPELATQRTPRSARKRLNAFG